MMEWRFGGDLGAGSFGWCVVELGLDGEPWRIAELGSRIFGDGRVPKSGESLAMARRQAKAQRRGHDRFQQRQQALLRYLTRFGLFPPEDQAEARHALELLDPYELRARALREWLPLHHLGRALFHLNQRRGFKSNRRTDRVSGNEAPKIRVGVARLQERMREAGVETLGAYLHWLRSQAPDANRIPSVRARLRPETGEGAKGDGYDFYPDRAMLEEEFDAIWEAQAAHHPDVLTEAARECLFEMIFHQRPLKAPRIGQCTLGTGEERLPKSDPLFQERRLLEDLNHLHIVRTGQKAEPLKIEQRDALYLRLKDRRKVPFETLRTKVLKLDPDDRFDKEERRKELSGDEVAAEMANSKRFAARWHSIELETRRAIVARLTAAEDEAALLAWLRAEHGLTEAQARAVADAPLPKGHGRFGETATRKLIEALRANVITYSKAVESAGLGHHSDKRTGEVWDELPYYGEVLERHILPGTGDPCDPVETRLGRLTNPTVHIGLNQLRRVLNDLIRTYGPPAEIALEIARDLKLNDERKKELNDRNKENREAAERRSRKLNELGIEDTGANRARLKLWEELNLNDAMDRRCVYTGQQIGCRMVFSDATDIDHILPFASTLDDSQGNKILCMREGNRRKGKRPPFEAFGHTAAWEDIAARAARLPREKRWRFEPDAMERFARDDDFLARHLKDTQHLSRLAQEYAAVLYPDRGEGSSKVWVSPGRLTEMLRRAWGLNGLLPDHNAPGGAKKPKNRNDHRHHAIDAVVTAVTDRSMLQRIATASGRHGADAAEKVTADLPLPWEGFRDELRDALRGVVVSHRPDKPKPPKRVPGARDVTSGKLHNDTAYGLTGRVERGTPLVVHRIALMDLKPDDLAEDGRRVADDTLREALKDATRGWDEGGTDKERTTRFKRMLLDFARSHPSFQGIRRLRVIEPLSVIPIRDRTGRVYKGYKGDANVRYDVWELRDGRWIADVVSRFDFHQPGWRSKVRDEHHNARKVLSLFRDTVIAVERGQERELFRVVKFSEKQLALAEPHEANERERADNKDDPFRYVYPSPSTLRKWGAREVRIDALGRVWDPGPRSPA